MNDRPLPTGHAIPAINSPTSSANEAMQRDFINKLLADVPESDRWLLIAKEVESVSIAELSQMTGLTENTIKCRLFRIRQALAAAAHGALYAA